MHDMTWHDTTSTMTMNDRLWHQHSRPNLSPTQLPPVQSNWCILYTSVWSSTNPYLISLSSPIARDWHIDSSQSLSKSDRIHVTELWLLFTRYNDTYCYHIRFVGSHTSSTTLSLQNNQLNTTAEFSPPTEKIGISMTCTDDYEYVLCYGYVKLHYISIVAASPILQSRTTTRTSRCTFI